MIGDYAHPTVRLPGGGGAPEIASACGQIYVVMPQTPPLLRGAVDFITSFGHGDGRRPPAAAGPRAPPGRPWWSPTSASCGRTRRRKS